MHEITGPIMAITLVLSAVFIPCCFLGGVTGQFFRQFAVTIAVSTIISAINAITMTPSRAAMIFKTEEDADGHKLAEGSGAMVAVRHLGRLAQRFGWGSTSWPIASFRTNPVSEGRILRHGPPTRCTSSRRDPRRYLRLAYHQSG